MNITIRPMRLSDKVMVFEWRNMPFIYERGFSGQPVTESDHEQWCRDALKRHKPKTYIIEVNETPCGTIRFYYNKKTNEDFVSIYLLEEYTGKGIAPYVIRMACEKEKRQGLKVAEFLQDNEASKKAFAKAGFKPAGKDRMVWKP